MKSPKARAGITRGQLFIVLKYRRPRDNIDCNILLVDSEADSADRVVIGKKLSILTRMEAQVVMHHLEEYYIATNFFEEQLTGDRKKTDDVVRLLPADIQAQSSMRVVKHMFALRVGRHGHDREPSGRGTDVGFHFGATPSSTK